MCMKQQVRQYFGMMFSTFRCSFGVRPLTNYERNILKTNEPMLLHNNGRRTGQGDDTVNWWGTRSKIKATRR